MATLTIQVQPMRLSEHRYVRDLRLYQLAMRMLQHEARTRTIVKWTGVSGDRVAKLARELAGSNPSSPVTRHRGRSPYQVGFFFRTANLAAQASVLACYCEQLDVLPREPGSIALRDFACLIRGEHLCEAYEFYCASLMHPSISFEYAALLVTELARGEELSLADCATCGARYLVDRLGIPKPECTHCRPCYNLPAIPSNRQPNPSSQTQRWPIQIPLFDEEVLRELRSSDPMHRLAAESTSSGEPSSADSSADNTSSPDSPPETPEPPREG